MSFITIDNINSINAELSNFCNAACPMCARYDWNLNLVKNKTNNAYTTLEDIKNKIGLKVIKQLKNFYSCGTYGDGATNPECLEIYEHLRKNNNRTNLSLSSNGGTRSKEFWHDLAKLNVSGIFAIDGLQDTNHLYRRNVKWSKLLENINAFIGAGGKATWKFMRFLHNEKQVEEARKLSIALGFKDFHVMNSERWTDYDTDGNYRDITELKVDNYTIKKPTPPTQLKENRHHLKTNNLDNFETAKIVCKSCSHQTYEIYLQANGDVSPCCYIGGLDTHEAKKLVDDYSKVNIHHTDLKSILEGKFFKELERGIDGQPGSNRLQSCYFTCGKRN